MAVSITYELDQECTRVPYGPIADHIRDNRGFSDLRGRPDDVSKITECAQSAALARLLLALAQPSSCVFSLGCDLGAHRAKGGPKRLRDVAGGYIQVVCGEYAKTKPEDYRRFAEEIASAMQKRSSGNRWELTFVLKGVELHLDDFGKIAPSVWIWFDARAAKPEAALQARENLIDCLTEALTADASLAALKGVQVPLA